MTRAILLAGLLGCCGVATASAADAANGAATLATAAAETWKAEWRNRFADEGGEWVFVWTVTGTAVAGTVIVDGVTLPLEGRREGAWLEVSWKDAEGRTTQVRGVVGGGEWRGTVLSGGGGHMVEYGRMSAKPAR